MAELGGEDRLMAAKHIQQKDGAEEGAAPI